MYILVTGGAGFIGRHLVDFLLKEHKVRVYDDLSGSSQENISRLTQNGADFVKGSVLDYDKLVESSKGCDVVIHLAAKSDVEYSVSHPEATIEVNVNGTNNVLKTCLQNKIGKIVFASSAAVYGDCSKLPITEKSETNPTSPYGASKLTAEKKIKKFSKEFEINHVILRMFNVYGNGQNRNYAGVITKFQRDISENNPLLVYGNGEQTRDFVSIHDVVNAFDCALKSDKSITCNIASGVSISINELAEVMFDVLGKKLEIKYLERQSCDIQNSQADITLAKKELYFSPSRSLKEELRRLYVSSTYHERDLP